MSFFLILVPVLFLSACGKKVTDSYNVKQLQEETIDGTYSGILLPVNGNISGQVHGEVKVVKLGDDFNVEIKIEDAPSGIHKQSLHTGTECPQLGQDGNSDGYIDHYEAMKVAGHIIVPFDGDLSGQEIGENSYPSGSYHYKESTSYFLMLSDLHLLDEVSNDSFIKLTERDLPLERRVVMIYGKKHKTPASVIGNDIPIACGVLTKISESIEPEDHSSDGVEAPRRPRSDDRVHPRPRPSPAPHDEQIEHPRNPPGGWWDRMRQRWNRWRNRWNPRSETSQHN
jgi:hypothetical protein